MLPQIWQGYISTTQLLNYMSNYIKFPNNIVNLLNSKSKHDEAFTYVTIRNEIKDSSKTASYSQEQLAELLSVTPKTIYNHITRLKEQQLLSVKEKKQGEAEYPYNVYQFPELSDDFSIVLPTLISAPELTIKEKGILLFCKAQCESGTNHFSFKNKTDDLAKKIGVGKNQINDYLHGLEQKKHIRFIDHALIVCSPYFPLAIRKDYDNIIYYIIYKFCLSKDRVPPIKDKKAIGMLGTKYVDNYKQLVADLKAKCPQLPQSLHLNYFCQALLNKMPQKKQAHNEQYYL